jgi:hypothetical protein
MNTRTTWLKRIGMLGFLFFLLKGLVWLGLAGGAWAWAAWR